MKSLETHYSFAAFQGLLMFPFTRLVFQTYIKTEIKIHFQRDLKASVIMKTEGFNSEVEKRNLEGV